MAIVRTIPKLVICSTFRNATLYIDRYLNQISSFIEYQNWAASRDVHLILGYGDSIDGTGDMLYEATQFRFNTTLVEANHGGPHFGAVEDKRRFEQDAFIQNKVWTLIPDKALLVAFIDGTLTWQAPVLSALIRCMNTASLRHLHVLAPKVLIHPTNDFYDTWSFRRDGVRFEARAPYHERLRYDKTGSIITMDSVGSFFVIRGVVARQVRFSPESGCVGLCKQVSELDEPGIIGLNPTLEVYHI